MAWSAGLGPGLLYALRPPVGQSWLCLKPAPKSPMPCRSSSRWDSFTRFRRDAQGVVSRVGLLLLDEIHLLNDPGRGPTLEAVVARMRTLSQSADVRGTPIAALRTVSLSATIRSNCAQRGPLWPIGHRLACIVPLASRDGWPLAERGLELWLYIMATAPRARARRLRSCPCCSALCPPRISNHEDIARWLDSGCVVKAFDETYRPVPLQRGSMVRRAVQTATGRGAEGSRRPHVRTVAPAPGLHSRPISRLSCMPPPAANHLPPDVFFSGAALLAELGPGTAQSAPAQMKRFGRFMTPYSSDRAQ